MINKKKIAIIGSGPGAAIVCRNLINVGISPVVFEKGRYFTQSAVEPYSIEEIDQKYEARGTTAIFGPSLINYATGACLGGGSEVNAGLYYRTPLEKVEKWYKDFGLPKASIFDQQTYKDMEALLSVGLNTEEMPKVSKKFVSGAKQLGYSTTEIPRWVKIKKAKNGMRSVRQSMTEVFWNKNLDTIDLRLESEVQTILSKKNHVIIKWKRTGEVHEEHFDYIFLCAGAINTPYILMSSRLLSNNFYCNFSFHPTVKVLATFPNKVSDEILKIPSHQLKLNDKDIGLGVSIRTDELIKMSMISSGFSLDQVINEHEKIGLYYCMGAANNGVILKVPFLREPLPLCFLKKDVVNELKKGTDILKEILSKAGAKGIRLVGTSDELRNSFNIKNSQIKKAEKMTIHLMSSCPLGTKASPVNLNGRLKREGRVFIADSSIIPSVLGVNPQGTVMALANYVSKEFIKSFDK